MDLCYEVCWLSVRHCCYSALLTSEPLQVLSPVRTYTTTRSRPSVVRSTFWKPGSPEWRPNSKIRNLSFYEAHLHSFSSTIIIIISLYIGCAQLLFYLCVLHTESQYYVCYGLLCTCHVIRQVNKLLFVCLFVLIVFQH